MPDRYSYPNSLVLINKLGITDYDRWKAVETAAIHQRMVELTEHPIPGRYDLPHLQAIHQHLTADLYVWGGDIRDTDTHPGGTGIAPCRPPFIVPEAEGSDVGLVDSCPPVLRGWLGGCTSWRNTRKSSNKTRSR